MMAFKEVQWYDRNAVTLSDVYEATLGPHAEAARLTYTCPKDRKAMVELLFAGVLRMTAATVDQWVGCRWFITPKDGTETKLFAVDFYDKTAGFTDKLALGVTLTLHEGDKIIGKTTDACADGTVYHRLTYKLTEFDAYEYVSPPVTVPTPEKPDLQEVEEKPWWWPF